MRALATICCTILLSLTKRAFIYMEECTFEVIIRVLLKEGKEIEHLIASESDKLHVY